MIVMSKCISDPETNPPHQTCSAKVALDLPKGYGEMGLSVTAGCVHNGGKPRVPVIISTVSLPKVAVDDR